MIMKEFELKFDKSIQYCQIATAFSSTFVVLFREIVDQILIRQIQLQRALQKGSVSPNEKARFSLIIK